MLCHVYIHCDYSFFNLKILFSFSWKADRNMEGGVYFLWFIPQVPAIVGAGPQPGAQDSFLVAHVGFRDPTARIVTDATRGGC